MAINESDAFKIYDALKAGQIPDEMKPRAVSFLSAYRSENVKKMQDIFTNLQTLDKEDGSFITADRFSPGLGDQMRKREANILWLANRYNRPTTEVRGKYDVFKADASSIWNAGTLDDEAFFNKASEQVGIQKKKIDILNSAQEASFKSAVSLGDEVADFAAWQASIKDPEAFSDDAKNAWDDAKQKTLDRLGADGLGLADRIVRTLRHEQGVSTEPDAWINQTVEMLTQLKITDPDKYDLVKSVAIAKGEKSEKPQSDIAAGAIESFARTSADIIAGTPRYLTKIGAEGAALLAKSGITNAENPELLAARATAKPEVIDDLKDIARGVIDPIESRRKGWAKHAENTVYSIAGTLPTMFSAYIPGGQGALTGMFANESYEYFRRAGWSGPDALIASFVSGRIQAAAETASEVIGKIPWFAQWMSKYGVQPGMSFVKNWLTRTTVRGGVETAEEVFQQATSPAIQELLSSAIDNIPDLPEGQKLKDVMLELAKQENAIPLLLTSLSLGAVGASVSTTNDIAIAAAITRNPRLLRAVMSEADARKIEQEQDPAVRSEMIKKAWVATPKEQIISNIQKIVNEDGKAVEQSKSVLAEAEQMQMIPKIRRDDQGWKVEKNGQMVRVASREAAVKMAYSSLDDYAKTMHESMAVVADDLIGKKEAIEISTKAQTLEDEIREGRLSPVEAAQRAELSAKMSGMTPEQAQKARWLVMGKNNIETIDNVRTAVSRIFGGANVITVMHEHAHGRFAVALRDGYVTHDEGVSWVRLAENATGLEFLPTKDDAQVTPTMLDEAIVEVISADNVGRRKEDTRFTPGAISRGIAASLRLNKRNVIGERQKGKMTDEGLSKYKAFMDSYREFWGVVLRNAKALQKARKEGKLGDNYQDFLDKVMNVDMSTQQEAMTAKEAVDIVEGNPALSIRRATEMASEMRNDPAMIRKINKWNADRAKLGKNLEEADDEFFNVFWPELMKASGQRLKPSMRNINEAASRASEDIIQWLKENPKYLNYYAEDWQTTRDVLNIVFDNFTNDEFTGFRLITGLTSPATPLRGNLADAVQVMNLWKTKGNLDELELEISEKGNRKVKDGGPFKLQSNTGANKIFTLKVIEDLFRKFGSWDSVNQFLQEPVSSKELHAFKKQMGYAAGVAKIGQIERVVKEATGQEDLIPRMFIFGPKVGAYTLNAVGDSRYTTTDIWESRFIRSYFPEMFKAGTGLPTGDMEHEIFQSFASAFKTKIESLMGENFEPSALQAVRWFYMIFKTREAGYAYGNTAGTISDYAKLAAEQYLGFTFVDNQGGRSGVAGSQAGVENIPSERGGVQGENLAGVSGVPQVSGTTEERFSLRQRGGMGGDIGGLSAQGSQDIKSKVTPLEGLPSKIKVDGIYVTFGPFEKARLAAEKYVKDVGLDYRPPTKYVKVDEKRASRIAKAYDEMQHDPNDPAVKASYEALAKETLAQYEALKSTGISIEPIQGKDPYGNPRNAIIDVIENNHLWFTPTTGAFGGSASASIDVSGNPLLAETGETINGYKMLVNDVFRIVHDYFGHIKEGVGFRADGEENAWMSHAVMYSDLARPAMTTETRGQNSWVNFGPFGEFNKTASAEETQYAPQKTGLLPSWVMEEGLDKAFVTTGNSTTSYSLAPVTPAQDAEYLVAVEAGDTEKAQRMVDEEAKKINIYYSSTPQEVVQQIQSQIESVKDQIINDGLDVGVRVLFDQNQNPTDAKIGEILPESYEWDDGESTGKSLGGTAVFKVQPDSGVAASRVTSYANGGQMRKRYGDLNIAIVGGADIGSQGMPERGATIFKDAVVYGVLKFPIKSADPVTYDENGNVILLSQRFNPESPDTRYSLANRSLVSVAEDVIAAKMAKPEYKERFYSEARTRLANIRAKQGDVIPNEATKRDRQMAALRTLDAILAAFPPEIRGKVGGFVRMADMRTDKARQKELDHRLNILERYVENDAKKYYGEKMDKLIERARPKKEAGKKPKGKLGADVHDLFDIIEQAMEWTTEKADAHAEALESVIAGGTLTPEQEAHDMLEAQAVRLVAGWKDAQSAQREAAVKELTAVYENAYIEAKKLVILKRQLRDKQRSELIVATGKEGKASERDDREIKDAGTGFLFKSRSGFLTFKQVMRWAFGDLPIAKSIAERERIASNTMEDSIQSKMDGIESLFKFLAGSTYKGEQLRWEMSQKSIEVDGRKLSQFEAIAATMMWMQEDGRRHMIGNLDETGKPISKWHYNQKFVDAIEAKLSNEAKAVRTFLLNEYAQEWQSLNGVYSKLNGINLPNIPLYSPITVTPIQAKGNQMIDPVTGSVMSGASTTPGSLKSRSGKIAEPVFRDALKTYIAHTKQIEHWKAYAELLEDSRALFGDRNVLNAIEAASGLNGKSVIGGWIDYFAEGGNREAAAFLEFSQGVDRITSRAAGMALIGRIGTIFVQATQLAAAAAKIPFGAYTVRLGKLFAGQLDYSAAFNSAFIQRRIKQQPPLVQEAMKGLLAKKPSKVKQAQRELGKLISGADGLFTAGTFAIVYDYHLKQAKNMGLNAQAADDYAMKITEQIVDEIAQPTRSGARSLLENRLTGWGARLAWAFASESRKNLGLMLAESQDGITNSRFARAAFYVVILNSLASWIIRSAWNDAKDKEDDELFDERNWNLNRLAITVGTDWTKGVPLFGDMLQAGAFAVAGEYQPEGNLLSGAGRGVKAGLKLAERLNEDGVVDGLLSTDTVNDADLILSAMGLTNDNIAAAASIAHLLKDVTKIVGN